MPKSGSGKTLCATSAATTVVGTVTGYQSLGWNFGVEIRSPVSGTLAEDCRLQPLRSGSTVSAAERAGDWAKAKEQQASHVSRTRLIIGASGGGYDGN